MEYKQKDNVILCVKDNADNYMFSPSVSVDICHDEIIPWEHTDRAITRLITGQLAFEDTAEAHEDKKIRLFYALQESFRKRVSGAFTTTQGYLMQFDTSDSLKLLGAISLMEATGQTEGYLTQADDTTVYHVSLATMKTVLVEMLSAYAACHARKQELRAAIKAAETTEDLDAVVISWPV